MTFVLKKMTLIINFDLFKWICLGKYGPKEHGRKRTFPIPAIIMGLGLIINLVSTVAVYYRRRNIERSEKKLILGLSPAFPNRIPRSLESLLTNCVVTIWLLCHATASFKFKYIRLCKYVK